MLQYRPPLALAFALFLATTITGCTADPCTKLMQENAERNSDNIGHLYTFGVNCIADPWGTDRPWTIIQLRRNGMENFTRNWSDYKNGFGTVNTEYWMGLEKMHQMTKAKTHELWVLVHDVNGKTDSESFRKFTIGPESDLYRLYIGKMEDQGDRFNPLAQHDFRTFQAIDTPAKGKTPDCPSDNRSGWWYHACWTSHLNGVYNGKDDSGLKWSYFNDFLKYAHMAIRPIVKKT